MFDICVCIEVCLGFRDVSRLHVIRVNLCLVMMGVLLT